MVFGAIHHGDYVLPRIIGRSSRRAAVAIEDFVRPLTIGEEGSPQIFVALIVVVDIQLAHGADPGSN
jgi:hypothetical protein